MNGIQDMAFCSEIVLQVKIARRASERLEATKDNFDHIEVWCSIQSIFVAAGNISKILSPPDKKYKLRGDRLRQMLKVEEDCVLLDRKFRNNFFEHYDSRIEEWFEKYPTGKYVDLAMNPSFSGRNLNTHRGYNLFNNTLEFRGEILDLDSILIAMEKIFENCKSYTLI
ncbi:hypothetical protein [Flavobacterium sp.]|uniref:hypothetical protein n=1 Tax=Flavobacterium sp. TaxID=239 RepID=UPI004047FDB6